VRNVVRGEPIGLSESLQGANRAHQFRIDDGGFGTRGFEQAALHRLSIIRDDASNEDSGNDECGQQRPDDEQQQMCT
jgi:hypothetical protein